MNLLDYVAKAHGRQTDIASQIGVYPQMIWLWANNRRPVPIAHCLAIEKATNGEVTRQDLRPLDYWTIWPDLPAPAAVEPAEKVA